VLLLLLLLLLLAIPIEFTEDGEMGWLERVAVTASLQRAGHQVAEIDVGRRDVRRQGQFELRLG
jgi:hypothetical protein